MEDILTTRKKGPPVGHHRYGGRHKGSVNKKTAEMRELASQLGVDPVAYLCAIVACDGAIQTPVVDPDTGKQRIGADGKPMLEWKAITTRQRIDAAKELMPYLRPKLSATQLTGANEGPVQVATLDVTQILADPELARQAQRMALAMCDQQADADGTRAPVSLDLYPKPIRGNR